MTKRLNGAGKPGQYPRDPYDWYKETPESVEALFDALDFRDDLIFDPSCGSGNILDVAKRRGHLTAGADVIDRHARHPFQRGNFLLSSRFPGPHDRALSIVNNPPYNYVEGIAEQFIHKALADVPFRLGHHFADVQLVGITHHASQLDRDTLVEQHDCHQSRCRHEVGFRRPRDV